MERKGKTRASQSICCFRCYPGLSKGKWRMNCDNLRELAQEWTSLKLLCSLSHFTFLLSLAIFQQRI